jgi:cytochrome c peroxidase
MIFSGGKTMKVQFNCLLSLWMLTILAMAGPFQLLARADELDQRLGEVLEQAGFTGTIKSSLASRLGRPLNPALADLGRLVFFDNILGLHNDNACAGCHSPAAGFGDTQSIAKGTDNNGLVGAGRTGPRNQRRAPMMVNSSFYPRLMLNLRFASIAHDGFDMLEGVRVPFAAGGTTVWRPGSACIYGTCFDPAKMTTLLTVQGHIPSTEMVEMAGFSARNPRDVDPQLYHPPHLVSSGAIADTVPGPIPGPNGSPPDSTDTSYSIRQQVLDRFNMNSTYLAKFAAIYPEAAHGKVTFAMIGAALAEFQMSNTFADAPLDRFARGERTAMTDQQKRGALLFFGKAQCIACHAVAGESNEMFSDFDNHVAGLPQVAPKGFGLRPGGNPLNPDDFPGNVRFAGPDEDEDFGLEELTGDPVDRYRFRTSPLRNVALQPYFFHNGAFARLADALRYHMNTLHLAPKYDPGAAGLDADLTLRRGPIDPVLQRLDPRLVALGNLDLKQHEFDDLLAFVRDALLDPRALPANLCRQIPRDVPSRLKILTFQGCR